MNRGDQFTLLPDSGSKRKELSFCRHALDQTTTIQLPQGAGRREISRWDRQSKYFMISIKVPTLTSEKWFVKTWRWDVRPYLQKAGAGTELVVRYSVLKVWKLLPGTEQREYLLLVVWNLSHHQNYLQIPKIKEKQCYIWYKPVWEQILKTYANIWDRSIYSLIWNTALIFSPNFYLLQ